MSIMVKKIAIVTTATGSITAEILDGKNPRTAEAVWKALPIEGSANRWGDEIYFSVPVSVELEQGQQTVDVGAVGYWPPGKAICIFFGPTPVSRGSEPRAYSPVNVFAKVLGDSSVFKRVKNGEKVTIERIA